MDERNSVEVQNIMAINKLQCDELSFEGMGSWIEYSADCVDCDCDCDCDKQ